MCSGAWTSENNFLGNIFTSSAKKTFGTFNCKNIDSKINKNKNGQNQKPWFDQNCKFARQKYRHSKRRYKLVSLAVVHRVLSYLNL
jgi:hypothetical protein